MSETNRELTHPNIYLNEPDRPIYAVCRLMRQLPADITNAGQLTRDQSQMAEAVAFYAELIYEIVMDGLAELGKLMAKSTSASGDSIPNLGRLVQHLSFEAQFMREVSADYLDASLQTRR